MAALLFPFGICAADTEGQLADRSLKRQTCAALPLSVLLRVKGALCALSSNVRSAAKQILRLFLSISATCSGSSTVSSQTRSYPVAFIKMLPLRARPGSTCLLRYTADGTPARGN